MREFTLAYASGLVVLIAIAVANPIIAILASPIVGIFISRFISQRVIWWEHSNNIENIFRTKMSTLLLWPFSMPLLIIKMAVSKYL